MAKEQKSARELAKLLRNFAPELRDARFRIVAGQSPLDWRVQADDDLENASAVSNELKRAWAHVVYEYELKM